MAAGKAAHKNRTLVAALALTALISFYLYVSTCPPSVLPDDSGETATASLTLGIQHPPGYPLFSLLGKNLLLLPAGDYAYRFYVLSAAISALNSALLFLLIYRIASASGLFMPLLFSFFGAMAYATGTSAWSQAVSAKGGIYALNVAFMLLITLCLERASAESTPRPERFVMLAALLYGLSITNHLLMQLLLAPAYIIYFIASGLPKKTTLRGAAAAFLFFLLGAFVYYYLPSRATSFLNWGEPNTLPAFIEVLARFQYNSSEISKSLSTTLMQAGKFFSNISAELPFFLWVLAIPGIIALANKSRAMVYYLASVIALYFLALSLYLNVSTGRLYLLDAYMLPVYPALAALVSLGASYVFSLSKLQKPFIYAVAALLVTAHAWASYLDNNRSRYYLAYDFNKNLLLSADASSMVFMAGDGVVFPSWYLKFLRGYRSDLTLVGTPVLPMKWVRDNIVKQQPKAAVPDIGQVKIGNESIGLLVNTLLKLNYSKFPLYFTYNTPEKGALGEEFTLMPKGMIYRAVYKPQATVTRGYVVMNDFIWKMYSFRSMQYPFNRFVDQRSYSMYATDYSVARNSLGVFLEDLKLYKEAYECYRWAHLFMPAEPDYLYNMGNALYFSGNRYGAQREYIAALKIAPKHTKSWYNLGVVYNDLRDYTNAVQCFEKVRELDPSWVDIDKTIGIVKDYIPKM